MKFTSAREFLNRSQPRGDWYSIKNRADGSAAVYLYDEIGYWGTTAKDFTAQLAEIDVDLLDVYVSSIGGEVFDGIAIYNALRSHRAEVKVRVDSMAASIASVIVQAGDSRTMLTGSQMMIHNAAGLAFGGADTLREVADILDKQSAIIAGIYAERSGLPADGFRDMMAAETWMSAPEAVEAGLADEVVTPSRAADNDPDPDPDDTEAASNRWRSEFLQSIEIG